MRIYVAAILSLCLAGNANAQTLTKASIGKSATPLEVHTGGRVAKNNGGYAHQWPGVYFESRFRGRALFLRFDDPSSRYILTIDDQAPIRIDQPGRTDYRLSGLSHGAHRVRLDKISESYHTTGRFGGFYVPAGETPLPAPRHKRQIEFIGDSFTSGFGNTLNRNDCNDTEANAATDTSQTFGPIIARHYDADYQINAYSGLGAVRNYPTQASDPVLPALYENTLFTPSPYDHADWRPSIIVIALGGNDFSEPFTPDAHWSTLASIRPDFLDGYVAFIQRVRQLNPEAHIVLMQFGDGTLYGHPNMVADDAEVARRLAAAGDTRIHLFNTGALQNGACYSHLNVNDSWVIATRLIQYIDSQPDLWRQAKERR